MLSYEELLAIYQDDADDFLDWMIWDMIHGFFFFD
jgi:hypothetical protein